MPVQGPGIARLPKLNSLVIAAQVLNVKVKILIELQQKSNQHLLCTTAMYGNLSNCT